MYVRLLAYILYIARGGSGSMLQGKFDCGAQLLFDLEEIVDMWNRKGRRIAV